MNILLVFCGFKTIKKRISPDPLNPTFRVAQAAKRHPPEKHGIQLAGPCCPCSLPAGIQATWDAGDCSRGNQCTVQPLSCSDTNVLRFIENDIATPCWLI